MEIKICGITTPQEIAYLNRYQSDYAGFVFFEKSKRNISLEEAKALMEQLDAGIKRVAVMVSPSVDFITQVQEAGFDILQIHKELTVELLQAATLPVWYAFNVADPATLCEKLGFLQELPQELCNKIQGIVVDAANFGSGETFDWQQRIEEEARQALFSNRKFVLAGGLRCENVAEGIGIFAPDVVDVSSGVEGASGKKEEALVRGFIEAARSNA